MVNYIITCTFYSIFWLDSVYTHKKLKSLIHKNAPHRADTCPIPRKFEALLRSNLNHLNQILQQFHHRQIDYNFTLARYFPGIAVVGYTFPFIYLFNNDDWISFTFCVTLYVQGMANSIYSIIAASSYLNRGVSLVVFTW